MYHYQENDGQLEIYFEDKDGFKWICDCGSSEKQESWDNVIMITMVLNNQ